MGNNDLIILKNSSYAKGKKYIVDAEDIMYNFKVILESMGSSPIKNVIEATGQVYNALQSDQFINALTQLILASNFFKDIGTTNNIVLDAYTPGYGVPTQYIDKMVVKFRVSNQNTGSTTLSFKGLSGAPLLTDTLANVSSGMLVPGIDYQATYSEKSGAFILSSTVEDSGSISLESIRRLVESSGMVFSSSLTQQLSQAVSMYAMGQAYKDISSSIDINQNNYLLSPYDNFIQVYKYYNGLTIRFRPKFTNTLINPTVQVSGLQKINVVSTDGYTLEPGDISQNFDSVVRYQDGIFYLVHTGSSLKLSRGVSVNSISNDPSLINGDTKSLVTEYAVRSYVDSKVGGGKAYAVVSGEENQIGEPNYLRKLTDTTFEVVAGEVGNPSYDNILTVDNVEASPNKDQTEEEGEVVTYTIANCFDGDNSTYYETKDQGQIVAGVKNAETGEGYVVMPNFVGANFITDTISRVRFLGYDPQSMPQSVFFQYSIDGGANWFNVGTEIYDTVNDSGVIVKKVKAQIYQLPYLSGDFINLDLNFKPYVDPTDPENSEIADNYSFRCYANEFNGVNTGWKLVAIEFCKQSPELKPLVVNYANGVSDIITSKETVPTNEITASKSIIFRDYPNSYTTLDSSMYYESITQPARVEEGTRWVKITNGKVQTLEYQLNDDGVGSFVEKQYVKIGELVLTDGVITSLTPVAFNGIVIKDNLQVSNPIIVNHNIGSLSTAKAFLVCNSSDLGYEVGDTVELSNQSIQISLTNLNATNSVSDTGIAVQPHSINGEEYNHTVVPGAHKHNVTSVITGNATPSYVTVSSGYNTAKIMFSTIVIPHKTTGTLTPITNNSWSIYLKCERNF